MALAYKPPGITIEELASPSVNSILAVPATIGIVGLSQGYTTKTVDVSVGPNPASAINDAAGINASAVSVTLDSATNYPASGVVKIGSELIGYSGKTSTTLTGLTRGLYGSTAATHADNAVVNLVSVITVPAGSTFQTVSGSQSFISVKDTLNPTKGSAPNNGGYLEDTDFDANVTPNSASVTIQGLAGDLDDVGSVLRIVYRYLPDNYFSAIRLDSQAAVEARFGSAYASDAVGNATGIGSAVSYAANLAFENGATDVIIQPLFALTTPSNPDSVRLQPSNSATDTQWEATLTSLRDIEDINLLVPAVGQSDTGVGNTSQLNILQKVQDHVAFMKTQGQYVIAIVGEDGGDSSDVVDAARLRADASLLRDRHGSEVAENIVFVSPARFSKPLPQNTAQDLIIGGQYVAAAIAGMIASRAVFSPLTRRQVSGIKAVLDPRDRAAKDQDANAGLLVVEQRGLAVQVRHGITLDNSSTARRELSIVRAKHRMIESIRATLDANLPIVAVDNDTPTILKTIIIGVLEGLKGRRELVDYSNVQARVLLTDPTTGEVRFSYRPAFPLNNVDILFSIDLTSGTITAGTP